MKRRWIAGMMSAALLMAGMALPVYATTTNPQSDNINVSYTVPERYTLSIPASTNGVTLSASDNVTTTVGVIDVSLLSGSEIQVSVTAGVDAAGTVELKQNGGTETIVSDLTVDSSPVKINEVFATFTANSSKTLTFSPVQAKSPSTEMVAGDYSTTLTFSASIGTTTTTTP